MTYLDTEGTVIDRRQIHGVIVSANDNEVSMQLAGSDEQQWLPPHLEAYQNAEEGEYRLRETGELVVDPDPLCTWTIQPGTGR